MKTPVIRFLLLLSLVVLIRPLSAQEEGLRTATRLGLGSSMFTSGNFSETPDPRLLAQLGGVLVYGFNRYLGIRGDLQLSYTSANGRGVRHESGVLSGDFAYTEKYMHFGLGLPLTLRIGAPTPRLRPYLDFGPMVQANLFATEERIYDDQSYNDQEGYSARKMDGLTPLTYYMVYGIGLELKTESGKAYFLEFRGFSAANRIARVQMKEVSFSGFTFGGGVLF